MNACSASISAAACMLTLEDIDAHYSRAHILADVSLDLHPGEVVVLLGRNGAGKSTTMKTAIGLVRASKGKSKPSGRRRGFGA